MLPLRGAARVLGHSARPRMTPGASSLYTRQSPSPSILRPALAPGASSRRNFSIVEPMGQAFMAIHSSTGLPWYLLIPTLSFAHAALFDLPFGFYNNHLRKRTALVEPLIAAWRHKTFKAGLRNYAARAEVEIKRIRTETKTQRWRVAVPRLAVTMPTWVLCMMTMRHLANEGTPVDPSLATEGCLWFGNLAAADPLSILPLAVGLGFAYRSLPKSKEEFESLLRPGDTSISTRLRRGALFATPFMVNFIMGMPSGALLFWLATMGSHRLCSLIVERYILQEVPKPEKSWGLHVSNRKRPK